MNILFIVFIPFFFIHCLGNHHQLLQKTDVHLTKLENGKMLFKYEIETVRPLWMRIDIYETREENNNNENVKNLHQMASNGSSLSAFFETIGNPGMSYTFKITIADDQSFGTPLESWKQAVATSPAGYKYLSQQLLKDLMNKAVEKFYPSNGGGNRKEKVVEYFQMTKDAAYWEKVKRDGAIETSIRDGIQEHPSPLNYSYGVHNPLFSRNSAMPLPINESPFGDKRINLLCNRVLGNDPFKEFSFYFADIKCYGHSGKSGFYPTHYLTIAVSRKGTAEHKYCEEHLVPLPPNDNPFFKIGPNGEFIVNHVDRVWIEIFFMHQLFINRGEITPKEIAMMKTSSSTVITNDCPICSMKYLRHAENVQRDSAAASIPSARPEKRPRY